MGAAGAAVGGAMTLGCQKDGDATVPARLERPASSGTLVVLVSTGLCVHFPEKGKTPRDNRLVIRALALDSPKHSARLLIPAGVEMVWKMEAGREPPKQGGPGTHYVAVECDGYIVSARAPQLKGVTFPEPADITRGYPGTSPESPESWRSLDWLLPLPQVYGAPAPSDARFYSASLRVGFGELSARIVGGRAPAYRWTSRGVARTHYQPEYVEAHANIPGRSITLDFARNDTPDTSVGELTLTATGDVLACLFLQQFPQDPSHDHVGAYGRLYGSPESVDLRACAAAECRGMEVNGSQHGDRVQQVVEFASMLFGALDKQTEGTGCPPAHGVRVTG
jgi:hypothetical protein